MSSLDDYYTARLEGKVLPNFLTNTSTNLVPTINATTDLMNKVGLINIVQAPTMDNPYTRYMATEMPYGDYVENLQIGQVSAEKFNPTDCSRDFKKVDITSWYAELNDSYEYNVSTSEPELRLGVHDSVGLSKVADGLVGSMYRWARNDMVVKFAKQLARVSQNSTDTNGYTGGYKQIAIQTTDATPAPRTDEEIALDLLENIIEYVNEFKTMSTQYNKLGAMMTTEGRPDVIITRQMYTNMRQALGQTYHLDGFDIDADIVRVGSLPTPAGNLGTIGALIIDKRSVLYHQQWMNVESDRCVRGRYVNWSLAGRGTFNFLWGYNAIALMLNTTGSDYIPTKINMPTE